MALVRSAVLVAGLLGSSLYGNATSLLPASAQTVPPPLPTATRVNNPPSTPGVQILAFPQRDFVSASGYLQDDRVVVSVIHPSGTSLSTDQVTPQDDAATPAFDGIVEVNHPGGACWVGTTPDIRAGDKVRITIVANAADPSRVGIADETTVADVTAQRPVQVDATTVAIHGTAKDAAGNPLPVAQLEQRLVAPRDQFLLNGRRVLTSAKDGTIALDAATPTNWTATYTGLQPADVTRALGAESRIMWLGATPAAAVEQTIYEIGAGIVGGPAGPACTAPLEKLPPPPGSETIPPTAPTNLAATVANSNSVQLTWAPATDNVGVTSYGVYRDGVAIFNVENPDGSAPAPTSYTDTNVPPGTYTYTVDAADAIGNRSPLSNAAQVTTAVQSATLPAGVTAHEPPVAPVQIISFPSRDFVSSTGFLETDTVVVQTIRNLDSSGPALISTSTVIPQDDPTTPGFDGLVEVNHPGGGCWDGVTPDIRVGDIIRTIAYNPDGTIRTVDQTTTANVVAERPVVIQEASSTTAADGVVAIHGVAMDKDGNPLPTAQFEQRLIANRDHFILNGRRTIRAGGAGGDGSLAYDANDPTGTHWTATYSGLVAVDIDRIMGRNGFPGAESRALWLGSQPLAGLELTIYENAADPLGAGVMNGPAAGVCFAPQEPLDTTPPAAPSMTSTQAGPSSVQLNWTKPVDDVAVYGYGIYQDGKRVKNVGAAATSYLVSNVAPGPHTFAVDAVDAASPPAQFANPPAFNSPWGNRSALSTAAGGNQNDVTAPTVPQNLVATSGTSQVSLTWSAASDDVGVTGYGVYRGGTKIADVAAPATTYTDTGLAAGTYSYTVDAVDAATNRSAQSAAATANVTAVADAQAPTVPANLTASTSPDIHGRSIALTWTASTDNVGVTGYGLYRNGTKVADLGGTATSYTDANLAAGTYDYTVDAADSAGNRSAQSAKATAVVANDPPLAPHSLIGFPARDFISATGYPSTDGPYVFSAFRNGQRISVSAAQNSDATGLIEVNHPGGTCWTINTPDLRPGDVIRITNAKGIAEQTTIAGVFAQRPSVTKQPTPGAADGEVTVHGTAGDALGQPLPVDQVENRLIANRDLFAVNGARILRAGGAGTDGTLAYDAPGSTSWTAVYRGLNADDVARAAGGTSTSSGTVFVGAESRAMWLGRDPLALTETTIFEDGPGVVGGPSAPCTAPLEPNSPLASFAPASLDFGSQSATPASTSAARTVTLSNAGNVPLDISAVYVAGLNAADFAISSNTCAATLGVGQSCTVGVTFSPKALGARSANLSFLDNAANTTDQSVALSGNGVAAAAPAPPTLDPQTFVVPGNVAVNATLAKSTIPATISWKPGTGGAAVTSYELQQSLNGGAFTNVALTSATATSQVVNLELGTLNAKTVAGSNSYKFQVRACNGTSCSAWVAGLTFNVLPIDDSSTLLAYGGTWTAQNLAGSYGGTVRSASTNKDKVALPSKFTFTVPGNFAWVSTMGPDRGQASVSVDGGPAQIVDLYSPTPSPATVVWQTGNLAAGRQHSVTIQVLGTKNAKSTGTRVDMDALVALK